MVRKLLLLAVSCMAASALIGVPSASAITYPDCDAYGNEFGVFEFTLDTHSNKAYAVSGSEAHALICGMEPKPQFPFCRNGADTMADVGHLYWPPSTRVQDTESTSVEKGSYIGSSDTYAIGIVSCLGDITRDPELRLRAIDPDDPEAQPECADNADGPVVACYDANSPSLGRGMMASRRVKHEGGERIRLEINRPRTAVGEYSIVELTVSLCDNFGRPATQTCGTAQDLPTARNGSPSAPACDDGIHGIFRVRAHRPLNGGEWSPDTTLCEVWVPFGRTSFESSHT